MSYPYRWTLVKSEPDQVIRLAAFRLAHPDITIQPGEFATWEARIIESDGETTIVRHRLTDLLDRLDLLLGETA